MTRVGPTKGLSRRSFSRVIAGMVGYRGSVEDLLPDNRANWERLRILLYLGHKVVLPVEDYNEGDGNIVSQWALGARCVQRINE